MHSDRIIKFGLCLLSAIVTLLWHVSRFSIYVFSCFYTWFYFT